MRGFSDTIADSVCVSQCNASKTEERVILFLKMKDSGTLSDNLIKRLKTAIREELSPRHVPALILPIGDIPVSMWHSVIQTCLLTRTSVCSTR